MIRNVTSDVNSDVNMKIQNGNNELEESGDSQNKEEDENEQQEQDDDSNDDDEDNHQTIPLEDIKERLYCSPNKLMRVYELKVYLFNVMTEDKLWRYIEVLEIPNFRGIFKPNELPERINNVECGIIIWNDLHTHYTVYAKVHNMRMHFDPYGERSPLEIQKYLKTRQEYCNNL